MPEVTGVQEGLGGLDTSTMSPEAQDILRRALASERRHRSAGLPGVAQTKSYKHRSARMKGKEKPKEGSGNSAIDIFFGQGAPTPGFGSAFGGHGFNPQGLYFGATKQIFGGSGVLTLESTTPGRRDNTLKLFKGSFGVGRVDGSGAIFG